MNIVISWMEINESEDDDMFCEMMRNEIMYEPDIAQGLRMKKNLIFP